MLKKIRGIVLGHIPFKENSIIIRIYSEEFGTRGFIQSAAKSGLKKNKMAYYIPLSLLELVVYHKASRDLDRISEVKFLHTFLAMPFETARASIALFVSEVLNHSLRQEAGSREKFDFLFHSIVKLDNPNIPFQNFPIQFLFDLTFYLGFGPSDKTDLFSDLPSSIRIEKSECHISELIEGKKVNISSGKERLKVIEILINFYKIHLENFNEIKSLPILHQVLS
jgi:DNA repair protein RecO (recombination protein O)